MITLLRRNLLLSILVCCMGQTAFATSVNVHTFAPAANPMYTFTEDAILSSSWNPSGAQAKGVAFFSAYYDMVNDPLVELNTDRTARRATLVDSMNSLSLTVGYGVIERMQVGANTSLTMAHMSQPKDQQEFGLSDTKVFTKFRLNDEYAPVVFAVMPEVYAPTGRRDLYLSNDGFGGALKLIAERDFGVMQVAANAGYRYSPRATFRDLSMRSIVPVSLGAVLPLGPRWALNTDAMLDVSVPANKYENPSSVYLGFRYRLPQNLMISAGGAVGALNSYASADYRIVAGLTLAPSARPKPEPAPIVVSAVEKPRVVFTPKEVMVNEEVKFEHAKANLTPSGKDLLDEVAKVLKENVQSYKLIVIEGYANELGTYPYNQKLSEERAASVKEYLTSRGVDTKAFLTVGYGKTKSKPLEPGLSHQAWLEANRRVAFKVVQ